MSDDDRGGAYRALDDTGAVARRMSAEAMAARPTDQPSGDEARLSSVHLLLSTGAGAQVLNLAELHADGVCAECLRPRGARTDVPMIVRHTSKAGAGRRCDGVLATLHEGPRGPRYSLYSDRFLALLSDAERGHFHWRPVEVANPGKVARPLFELVASTAHLPFVALRGGLPDRAGCEACGHEGQPYYPLTGCLPTWLNPRASLGPMGQPQHYVNADMLPDPPWSAFSAGDWRDGPSIVVSRERPWPKPASPGTVGIGRWSVGAVAPWLIEREA